MDLDPESSLGCASYLFPRAGDPWHILCPFVDDYDLGYGQVPKNSVGIGLFLGLLSVGYGAGPLAVAAAELAIAKRLARCQARNTA
jgi:hypothetical protein